jgi:crotonobetainyl-CoA:carnitine CoA-transferase CaiB-like acyl-CoA transferase
MPADGAPGRGPLDGFRVVDLSTVLAGPYATMILGDLGADVIKVEPPEGDATRGWGPPWVGDASQGTRTAAYYLAVNRNKRSIRLDLRRTAGAEVLRRLLSNAAVLFENFRPGSL